MKDFICEVCGKTFKCYAYQRRGKYITCSSICYGSVLSKIKKGITPKNKIAGWNKGKSMPQISREKHYRWKGGTKTHTRGYKIIYIPNHPYSKAGYILEHRHIMEISLGRYLLPNEVVHHINGIKTDNRIENLKVITQSIHMKIHNHNRDQLGRFTS